MKKSLTLRIIGILLVLSMIASAGVISIDAASANVHSGEAAIMVDKGSPQLNRDYLQLTGGKTYVLTFWLKCQAGDKVSASLGTFVHSTGTYTPDDDKVDYNFHTPYTAANSEWNSYRIVIMPAATAEYLVGIDCRSAQNFYVDDVVLVESGTSINLTPEGDFEYAVQANANGDTSWVMKDRINDVWFSVYAWQVTKALTIEGTAYPYIQQGIGAVRVAAEAIRMNRASLSLTSGKTYNLSFWLRGTAGDKISVSLGRWVNGAGPEGYTQYEDRVDHHYWNPYTAANENWNKYTVVLTPTVTATDYTFGIDVRGSNDFYVDNVVLTEAGSDVNMTPEGNFDNATQGHYNDNGDDWMTANWISGLWFSQYASSVHEYGNPDGPKALNIVGMPSNQLQGGADPDAPENTVAFPVTEENVKISGRGYTEDDVIYNNYTCAAFEFRFRGTAVWAKLHSNLIDDNSDAYISVYIDGAETPSKTFKLNSVSVVSLAEGLADGEHTVKLLKITENRYSKFGVSTIYLPEEGGELLEPPAVKERKIEILGDSIACGAGNMAQFYNSPFQTITEDGSKSFGYLISQAFDADVSIVASSGQGVYCYGTENFVNPMPKVYNKVDMTYKSSMEWDFENFNPNLIIVALGTNDIWALNGSKPVPREEYKTVVEAFLRDIRAKNPDAAIVWVYGMMLQHYQSEFAQVIHKLNGEGDEKIYFIPVEPEQDFDRKSGHPSVFYHKWAAAFLTPELAKIMSWTAN